MNRNHEGDGTAGRGQGRDAEPQPRSQPPSRRADGDPNRDLEQWERELRGGPHGLGQDRAEPDRPTASSGD